MQNTRQSIGIRRDHLVQLGGCESLILAHISVRSGSYQPQIY